MKFILLNNQTILIDDQCYKILSLYRWYVITTGVNSYVICSYWDKENKLIRMHRFIMEYSLGRKLLSNEHIDHINGNGLDNRISNLRIVTQSQNCMNRGKRKGCSLQYKGVYFDKCHKKWRSQIRINGKLNFLGYFGSEKKAACVYNIVAFEKFGKFAKLNTVD